MAQNSSYPYPSTLNIDNFVTIKLSGYCNYSLWKAEMLCLLESQELIGFIDGTLIQLLDYLKWKRSDRLVKGWIFGSLTEEMLQYVVEKVSARDVWLELEKICCHNSLDDFQEGRREQPIYVETSSRESKKDYKYYLALYKASLVFIENLDDGALAIKDSFGETPLHYAARFGNLYAAKILVTRNSNLPHIVSNNGLYPIHFAAEYGYKYVDLVHYFFTVTKDPAVYTGTTGARLLHRLISSDLYDFATQLVKSYPNLAKYSSHGSSPLALLATKTFGTTRVSSNKLLSLTSATSWIFQARANDDDIENGINETLFDKSKSNTPEWKHQYAIKLAECLCEKLQSLSDEEINSIVGGPLLQAARFNNYKLIEIIVKKFPSSIYYCNKNGKNILHIAIENRCEKVFNFVGQMSQHRHHLVTSIDSSNNTMLHLAGKLKGENERNCTFGAALQMQEELWWFEAVKQMLPPSYYEHLNDKCKTAHQVFTEQHANLRTQGEKWMKDAANSFAIIAALIVNVAFVAAITFPGMKNCKNAIPISSQNGFFIAYALSNTVSLSTSCISLFAFVSILTSRYTEDDFLRVFPKRLLCGLLTLYASVEAMMLSFGCALYIVLDNKMVFYAAFIVAVLPILAFQHWRGPLINHLFFLVKRKKTML